MNKLIAPLILIFAFSMASCSKDTQKIIKSNTPTQSPVGPVVNDSDKVILNAKLNNFCEGQDCPEGIVAVKTLDKSVTCPGIIKSETEVLISQNCADTNETFHIQTTDGDIVKVESVEEELSNEFNDKVLKLTTAKEIKNSASISIPNSDNNFVEVLAFDKYGALTKQSCEITYASLAYANSLDNESQLLNIKNCDGVKDGSLISQDGNIIGFLTKKHEEIALYEGISLEGELKEIDILSKIDQISLELPLDSSVSIFSMILFEYPLFETDETIQEIHFDNNNPLTFKLETICIKKGINKILPDSISKLNLNNNILELNEETTLSIEDFQTYIPKDKVHLLNLDLSEDRVYLDREYYIALGDIDKLTTIEQNISTTRNVNILPGQINIVSKYLYIGDTNNFFAVDKNIRCK
ncbi:hypothetical protein ABMA70_09425 [Halobacteriovorax sp. XZX-3]|uniref:hypothetical protein n=1 Tax=unclassified Halobacteriovorax TaxID=2639665 RepID=UPI00371F5490